MALVKTKPTSAGRRHVVKVVHSDLHKGRPHSALVEKQSNLAVVTITVVLPVVTLAVVTNSFTVLSISNATKMAFQPTLSVWNMIQTVLQT